MLNLSVSGSSVSGQAQWVNTTYWEYSGCPYAGNSNGTSTVSGAISGNTVNLTFAAGIAWDGSTVYINLVGYVSGSVITDIGGGNSSFALGRSSGGAAFSNPGNSPKWEKYPVWAAEPVDTENGAQVVNHSIFRIKGARDLSFEIDYNSLCLSNDFAGVGWSHNFEARVQSVNSTNLSLIWNAKRSNSFTLQSGTTNIFKCANLTCIYDSLVKNSDGSYTLIEPTQRQLRFDSQGRLQKDINPHGQTIQLVYNGTSSYPTQIVESISGAALNLVFGAGNLLSQVSDGLGRTVSFYYDSGSHLMTVTKANQITSHQYTFTYDSNGRMLTENNPEGVQIFGNTYDAYGRVSVQRDAAPQHFATYFFYNESQTNTLTTTVIDRMAGPTRYIYDTNYLLLRIVDPLGHTNFFGYDSVGNRIAVTNALAQVQLFGYDSAGNLTSATDSAGNKTISRYDSHNNLTNIVNAASSSAVFTYDTNNNLTVSVDFLTNQIMLNYDSNSLLKQTTSPRGGKTSFVYAGGLPALITDAATNTTGMAYDAVGRVIAVTNGAGFVTTNAYDMNDYLVATADGLGNLWQYTRDSAGRILTSTDPLSQTTTFNYNGNGDLISKQDPLWNSTTYTYDGEERLLSVTDPNGHIRNMTYDVGGRLTSTSDALNNTTWFHYDAVGNLTSTIDALGIVGLTTTYDVRNLPTNSVDALSHTKRMSYDSLQRLTQIVDALNRTNALGYDALSHLTNSIDPLALVTGQRFDADGNRTTIINPKQAQFGFQYDLAGRLTATTTPTTKKTSYFLDGRNYVTNIVQPSGAQATLRYDAAGHLTNFRDSAGSIVYGYDNKGRLLTTTENSLTITRQYDALDRLTNYTDAAGNVLQYSYDNAGNLTMLTYPDGKTVGYTYDAANRMVAVVDWEGRQTTYSYDADNRVTNTTYPNGTRTVRTYDIAGRLAQQTELSPLAVPFNQINFTYDSANQILGEFKQPPSAAYQQTNVNMSYDADNALTAFAGQTVTNDANGNMIYGPITNGFGAYTYDVRNRLMSAGGLSYAYDPSGNRVAITNGASVTRFVVNPNAPLSQALMRIQNGITNHYVYGLGLLYEITLTGSSETGRPLFYHRNYQGDIVAMTDFIGNVTDRMSYSPYGLTISRLGTNDTSFLNNGNYGVMTDKNGLLFMRGRFYNPQIARFFGPDPSGIAGGLNSYQFAHGNPKMLADPTGLCPSGSDLDESDTVDPAFANALEQLAGKAHLQEGMEALNYGEPLEDGWYKVYNTIGGENDIYAAETGIDMLRDLNMAIAHENLVHVQGGQVVDIQGFYPTKNSETQSVSVGETGLYPGVNEPITYMEKVNANDANVNRALSYYRANGFTPGSDWWNFFGHQCQNFANSVAGVAEASESGTFTPDVASRQARGDSVTKYSSQANNIVHGRALAGGNAQAVAGAINSYRNR